MGALAAVALLSAPGPAVANDHFINVREVFAGTLGNPNAQFVELQLRALNHDEVLNNQLRVYDSAGTLTDTVVFPNKVANPASQASILIATTNAASFFGVTPDFTMPAVLPPGGGQVCYFDVDGPTINTLLDCASWGNYTGEGGAPFLSGTPFNLPGGIIDGRSMLRDISAGDPNLLEAGDDTNDSAADFDHANPAIPRNNAGGTTTTQGSVAIVGGVLTFTPGAGVANKVDVSLTGSQYSIRDNSAPVDAGAGCTQQRTNNVRCPVASVSSIQIDTGAGNDRVTLQNAVDGTVNAGAGDDQLISRNGDSVLNGGDNIDSFDPGTGTDEMIGGASKGDVVTYAPRLAGQGVSVSLDDVANDGNADDQSGGVTDNVHSDVERVIGGAGADEIIGSSAINRLIGGAGEDIVSGLAGNDDIRVNDGVMDGVSCGAGADDTVLRDPGVDAIAADCEHLNP